MRLRCFPGQVGHLQALGCGKCGGLWLDNAGTREVLDRYDIDASNLAHTVDGNAEERGAASPLATAAGGCPGCRKPLTSATYDGVCLDFCVQHGTFFDRGELGNLLQKSLARLPAPAPACFVPSSPLLDVTEFRHELDRHDDRIGTAIMDWLFGSHDWVNKWWSR